MWKTREINFEPTKHRYPFVSYQRRESRAKANMVKARGMKCGSSLELAAGPLKLQCYKKRKIEKQAKKSSQNNNYNLKKVIQ